MTMTLDKSHLTATDILIELRGWSGQTQAEPAIVANLPNGDQLTQADCVEAIDALLHRLRNQRPLTSPKIIRHLNPDHLLPCYRCLVSLSRPHVSKHRQDTGLDLAPTKDEVMRLPHPYTLEDTLAKLRAGLAATRNEDALALLEKVVTKARDDKAYAHTLEETLLRGSTIEIRECLSCFGDYFERSRDNPSYYPHHDAVNGIDDALYAILFDAAHPEAEQAHE